MSVLLAIGLGYSAKTLAPRMKRQGWRIIGSARRREELEAITASGYEAIPIYGDAPSPELAAAIAEATHVLISTPPGTEGDPV
ncbi:MAG: NAD(P)-dependent oxidoreductase, partial [Alphaproteobacteria bacterium]